MASGRASKGAMPSAADAVKVLPGAENAGKPGYYTVQRGDTLMRIGLDNGQAWRDLVRWNNLSNPDVIEVGQVLRVAPPGAAVDGPGVVELSAQCIHAPLHRITGATIFFFLFVHVLDTALVEANTSRWGRLCPPMLACLDDLFSGHGEGAGWELPRPRKGTAAAAAAPAAIAEISSRPLAALVGCLRCCPPRWTTPMTSVISEQLGRCVSV